MKTCSKCKIEKSFDDFSKTKRLKDGLQKECIDCVNKYNKEYYIKNKTKINKQSNEYRINNLEKHSIVNRIYYEKNRKKIIKNNYNYKKNRIKKDPLFKLTCRIRTRVWQSIKNNGYTKRSKTYNILGCTYEEFKIYIENQFTEGMSWENQGKWHLDHIYPVSLSKSEEEIIKLNHYTNFQPLWAEENIRKGNRLDY